MLHVVRLASLASLVSHAIAGVLEDLWRTSTILAPVSNFALVATFSNDEHMKVVGGAQGQFGSERARPGKVLSMKELVSIS